MGVPGDEWGGEFVVFMGLRFRVGGWGWVSFCGSPDLSVDPQWVGCRLVSHLVLLS